MEFYNTNFCTIREGRGLTLQEIGDKIGVSKQTVQKWESGRAKPRAKRVYDLAKILGCSAVDISDLKPEKWLTDQPEIIIPDDVDFARVLEMWPKLTSGNRARVAALAMDLVEKSGYVATENDMGKSLAVGGRR